MMDIDYFKQVNDIYGHDTGDQALIHVANILKEVSYDIGLPVRYAGDEFMILLPDKEKKIALEVSERLLQSTHEKPLYIEEMDKELFLTLSIGVASAPDDAEDGKALIQKVDAALYHAKKSGRDRAADVAGVVLEDISPKIAIQQLEKSKIAGRKTQLTEVANALKKFSQRTCQFLIIEGTPGIGKSTFLEEVQRSLKRSRLIQIKTSGVLQERFRPYYLITNILVELLNQREDKGKTVLETLTSKEIDDLSCVLPQLGGYKVVSPEEGKSQREGIFRSLQRFLIKIVDSRPFVLLVDDMHFADDASLMLLRMMIHQAKVPFFLCGTVLDFQQTDIEVKSFEKFYQSHGKDLAIQRISLSPLTEKDIRDYLEGIFPSLEKPPDFEHDLVQITQGNPLFLSEILSKLVHDQKIVLLGQKWVIRPLDKGYLPKSLDEIIVQKIAFLDEESKRILDHASTFGESISLSMLTGSSENRETKVLEFLDKAIACGLVSSDFQIDDENIRFLSKRVQEIVYDGLQTDQKNKLHEKIATYQEKLFQNGLWPSLAILSWHFKRSSDLEKARSYEQQQLEYSKLVYDAEEAAQYAEEGLTDVVAPDVSLDPESMKNIPHFFRSFLIAVRSAKLYPEGSKARTDAIQQFRNTINQILTNNERLRVVVGKDSLLVNGEGLDLADLKSMAKNFGDFLSSLELNSLAIKKGYSDKELDIILEALALVDRRKIHPIFWQQFSEEKGLSDIELKQVRFTKVEEDVKSGEQLTVPQPEDTHMADDLFQSFTENGLNEEESLMVPEVLGALMSAHSKMKLYSLRGMVTTDAIAQVMTVLQKFLSRRPLLTLAIVDTSLLVNGAKIDIRNFKILAIGFTQFLQSAGLKSLTFLEKVSSAELTTFLSTVLQHPASKLGAEFWRSFAEQQNFKGILFDQYLYGALEEMLGAVATADIPGGETGGISGSLSEDGSKILPGPLPSLPEDTSCENLAKSLRDLYLKGEETQLASLLDRTFEGFVAFPLQQKKKIIDVCKSALMPLEYAFVPPPGGHPKSPTCGHLKIPHLPISKLSKS